MNVKFTFLLILMFNELTIMKKILFSLAVALGLFGSVNSLLPDGTLCLILLNHINGNTHNLYSYLDAGYTVVIDVSVTWCHLVGLITKRYSRRLVDESRSCRGTGVSASTTDDVIVLWIEGDVSTSSRLTGNDSRHSRRLITGTNFPIIDDATIAQTLGIAYFPTLYTVYPDRYLQESTVVQLFQHFS